MWWTWKKLLIPVKTLVLYQNFILFHSKRKCVSCVLLFELHCTESIRRIQVFNTLKLIVFCLMHHWASFVMSSAPVFFNTLMDFIDHNHTEAISLSDTELRVENEGQKGRFLMQLNVLDGLQNLFLRSERSRLSCFCTLLCICLLAEVLQLILYAQSCCRS